MMMLHDLAQCLQVRCYELSQLSLKFERHLDSEIVDFEVHESANLHFHSWLFSSYRVL